jgi:hypothetical protein
MLFCMAVEAQENALIELAAERRPAAVMSPSYTEAFVVRNVVEAKRRNAPVIAAPLTLAALVRDHAAFQRLSHAPAFEPTTIRAARVALPL